MAYLYGDSTPSQLNSNFLEFLRDSIDFAVFVLQADERIKAGKVRIAQLREEADRQLAELDRFASAMSSAIEAADSKSEGAPARECARRLAEQLASTQGSVADSVRSKLAAEVAAIDADEATDRAACVDALGALLAPHTPPGTTTTLRIVLTENGTYDAYVAGDAPFGLEWVFLLSVPPENAWASVLRLEQIAPSLEIRAPLVTGWINKEVKVRPQRLERHVVTELTATDGAALVELRTEPGSVSGFDLEVDLDTGALTMARVGPSDDAAVGAFEVHPEDQAALLDVTRKLMDSAAALERVRLVEANVADGGFAALETFAPFVERLIAVLAPITREIAKRSLTPTELVLRRALSDDRREELFVTKSALRAKYTSLPTPLRALFAPLGLDADAPPQKAALPPPPAARSEISASRPAPTSAPAPPQPPAAKPPPPPAAKPPPPPPPPNPPRAAPPLPVRAQGPSSSEPTLEIVAENEGRNESFVEAVKKIVLVLRSGQTDEGYRQYAELLSSPGFTEYRADDQRQALKLLLMAKAPPTRSEAVEGAYSVALTRIQALVDTLAEPTDYEMLGVAYLQLGNKKAAGAAWETALKLERARDPASELCASLARRVSQLNQLN